MSRATCPPIRRTETKHFTKSPSRPKASAAVSRLHKVRERGRRSKLWAGPLRLRSCLPTAAVIHRLRGKSGLFASLTQQRSHCMSTVAHFLKRCGAASSATAWTRIQWRRRSVTGRVRKNAESCGPNISNAASSSFHRSGKRIASAALSRRPSAGATTQQRATPPSSL